MRPKFKLNSYFEHTQLQARDAIVFLENHPALCDGRMSLFNSIDFSIETVNHRGHNEQSKNWMTVRYSPENYIRFKKEFDKELKEYTGEEWENQRALVSIEVPYKKLYCEEWVYSHIEYWGELTVYFYKGNMPRSYESNHNPEVWVPVEGGNASGRTFEEMMINMASMVKRDFGKFCCDDFFTKKEIANHEKHFAMIDGKKQNSLVSNPKYLHVTPAMINLRWQKWFFKTPKGKKMKEWI